MLVLTVDELRALDRVCDLVLPRFVTAGDEQDLRVDTAALRGLAVRGLVSLDADVVPAPALARHLAPCRATTLIAELDVEDARYAVLAASAGPVLLATEQPGGFVQLTLVDADAHDTVRGLCRPPVGGGGGARFTVDACVLAEAEDLVLAGDSSGAVAALVSGGAPSAASRAWVAAVLGRRAAVSLQVARCAGPGGPFEGGEVRWVVAGDGTVWLLDAAPPDRALIAQVSAAELGSAVREVMVGVVADAA